MKCSETDCPHEAQFVPKLCVPASGYPQDETRAIQMLLNVPMCRRHCEEFKPEQILDAPSPRGGSTFRDALPAIARLHGSTVAPDGNRAWIVPVRLDSKSHQDLLRLLNEKGPDDGQG